MTGGVALIVSFSFYDSADKSATLHLSNKQAAEQTRRYLLSGTGEQGL
jgi:hypothetical protein